MYSVDIGNGTFFGIIGEISGAVGTDFDIGGAELFLIDLLLHFSYFLVSTGDLAHSKP